MGRMRLASLAPFVAVLVLATTSCGGDSPEPVNTAEGPPAPTGTGSGNALTTNETLVDAEPVRLSDWETVSDDVLRVHFRAGPSECFGASVDVEESDDSIRVNVSVGYLESAASADCAAIALDSSVDIHLESPIADRQVIDANAGA